MNESHPLISLCIPTNGATHWVIPTVENIYQQDCPYNSFEVVVVDNAKSKELKNKIKALSLPNLKYVESDAQGFENQIFALEQGKGVFCKLYNHRLLLRKGILKKMITFIELFKDEKPILFFSQGNASYNKEYYEIPNFELFVRKLSYWTSWSGGIGIWNEDIPQIKNITFDKMFPCTSLLFDVRKESKFVVWNVKFDVQQDDKGKGGYNLFETFAIGFLDIINDLRKQQRISIDTFNLVRNDMLKYLSTWYYKIMVKKENYTFETTCIKQSMSVYFSSWQYKKMIIYAHIVPRLKKVKRIPSFIYRKLTK